MGVVRKHRAGGGTYGTADDAELDAAFGLNRKDELAHGDLAWVKNKPGGINIGHGNALARYADYDHDPTTAHWQFFGTDFTCRVIEVEVVRKVTVVWA